MYFVTQYYNQSYRWWSKDMIIAEFFHIHGFTTDLGLKNPPRFLCSETTPGLSSPPRFSNPKFWFFNPYPVFLNLTWESSTHGGLTNPGFFLNPPCNLDQLHPRSDQPNPTWNRVLTRNMKVSPIQEWFNPVRD
jgi:hypothetical protein